MPFAVTTLGALVARTRADFRTRLELLPGASPTLRVALASIAGAVWAGAVHLVHGHLGWAAKQLFSDTMERDSLIRRAAPYGITPTPATYATGFASGTGDNGSPVASGTILVRADGVRYQTTADAEVSNGDVLLAVEALLAGAAGNASVGTELTFETPVAGVNSAAEVVDEELGIGLTGGNEEESTDSLRDRYHDRLQEPPEGGADHDYEQWAREVPGVTRAWIYPHEGGLGTVTVRFVRDGDALLEGADPEDIIPSVDEVAAVQAKFDAERPITAEVTAVAPVAVAPDFELSITPDNSSTRAAVEAALAALLGTVSEPGDGDGRGTLLLSQVQTAVGNAAGVTDFTIAEPAANVVPALGELFIFDADNVTFT